MNRLKLLLLGCVAVLAFGCGTSPDEVSLDNETRATQELTGCTATCEYGTVSCPSSATTCSATHYVGVTCDGVDLPCPPPPECDPSLLLCTSLSGQLCNSLNEEVPCCVMETTGSWESSCVCFRAGATRPPYRWMCAL
ncbi:hypothetical protein LXT21_15800 [Myxococcus sp. K38C18041901]|uniref:hypothetical protein n=1 Tax=Myxococcus guangdongensis TaxID=2906760 RepID=UPI0020A73009|nr:hypothetical protein [Myxococcus guangdongensis]MCP3060246.1 hypothetical protein [Myxococcus guangdongensis]